VSWVQWWGWRDNPPGVTQSHIFEVVEFAAVDGLAFAGYLMVADSRDLPSLDELIGRPAWQRRAACRGEGTQAFIVGRGAHGGYAKAKALCCACPVAGECLEYALSDEDLVGYWASTTGAERRQMRASRGVA
jgi:WhiB family redox-sensing transcriptional regulator